MPALVLALAGLAVTAGLGVGRRRPGGPAALRRRAPAAAGRARLGRETATRVRALRARGDRYRRDQRGGARGAGGDARRAPAGTDPGRSLAGELLRPRGAEGRRADRRRDRGEIDEAWRDYQVETDLARGYEGAIAQTVNAPTSGCRSACSSWPRSSIPAAASPRPPRPAGDPRPQPLAAVLQPRRDHRLGRADLSGARLLSAADARRRAVASRAPGPLLPWAPVRWLAVGVVVLAAARIALNVIDSQVIDIGVAGVIGADRIADGAALYEGHFADLAGSAGTSTGPSTTWPTSRSSRSSAGTASGTTSRPRTPRRSASICSASPGSSPWAGGCGSARRAGARLGPRLRLGRLPVDALRHERERQRRARRAALDRSPARVALAARPRR